MCIKSACRKEKTMRKARKVIKTYLDNGYIDTRTTITISDPQGNKVESGRVGSEKIRKYYERDVENVSCRYGENLAIFLKKERFQKRPARKDNEELEFDDLLMELTEKVRVQQTVHNMLYLMEQWDDTSMSAIRARSALEFWKKDINEEIENLQRSIDACQSVQPDAHTDEEGGIKG